MAEAGSDTALSPSTDHTADTKFEMGIEENRCQQKYREKWSFNFEFVLAAVGVTNVYSSIWRFPILMYTSGGVLFLCLYISCLLLFGVPMFYMETCLGQFWGKGPFHIWKFCPLFRGVGVSFIFMNVIYVVYTNSFLSWFLYYTFLSLSHILPWTTCDNPWNTANCAINGSGSVSPATEYFENRVLQLSDGIDNLGSMRWELVGCMFGATLLIFGALFWGIRFTGKILYVTVPLPLLIMFILFIRGMTLPGGPDGPAYLLYPDFRKLESISVWRDSFLQAVNTFGVSNGVVQTLASYNNFKAPCLRYSFIVSIITTVVGILAGLALTSLISGYAYLQGLSVSQLMARGPGLIFMTGSEVLSILPAASFWCFIFFFMLLLLGVTNQFLCLEVFIRTVMDIIPRSDRVRRILVVAVVCFVSFLFTLPFLTQGGMYLINLFDWYSWQVTLPVLLVFECATVTWIYGLNQFSADIKMMTGLRLPIVYKFLWAILIPSVMMIIYSYMGTNTYNVRYRSYVYPQWADRMGYFLAMLPLFPVPVFVLFRLITGKHLTPLDPDLDCRPDTDQWPEYNANQRQMERSVRGNLRAIFRI